MKRYIAQFKPWTGGLYVVLDTDREKGGIISEPMPYHEANDQARKLNQEPAPADEWSVSAAFTNWLPGTYIQP